ncbi:neuropilin-1-like [Ixodes scapularis]
MGPCYRRSGALFAPLLWLLVGVGSRRRDCGDPVVRTAKARLTSPNYPLAYPAGVRCSYRVLPSWPGVCAVLLSFEDMDIEGTPPNCERGDVLRVPSTGDSFCGVTPPESLVLPLPQDGLTLEFSSDAERSGVGFALRLAQVPNSCPTDVTSPCGGRFSEQEFRIEGPSARSGACLYLVTKFRDDVCQLQLRYDRFSVGDNASCTHGRRLIVAGTPECGRKPPGKVDVFEFPSRTLTLLYLSGDGAHDDSFVLDFFQEECPDTR